MYRLVRLLNSSGLQVHKAIALLRQGTFFSKTEKLARLLMKLTPVSGLLVCAHKRIAA